LPLAQGDNLIVVTASDADGLTGEDQISVRYDADGSNGEAEVVLVVFIIACTLQTGFRNWLYIQHGTSNATR
jgi:hypothetical protein